MKLAEIKINPKNPRIIKDFKFEKLVKSIKEFPAMLALRPLVIDDTGIVLGGNMRLKALQELKYKDIPDEWVKRASELTEDEKKRFVVVDNMPFGEWDMDILANEFEKNELLEWGFDDKDLFGFDESDFDPVGENEQGKLDEKSPKMVSCPECKHIFNANENEA